MGDPDNCLSKDQHPRVYLHIGEPKTGTTYLQGVLWSNRTALAAAGLLLPGTGPRDHFRAAQDLRGVAKLPDDPAPVWTGEWDRLARRALAAPAAAVISHELLCAADPAQAARAVRSLAGADVRVIVTVRDLARLVPAEWQETVKHRSTRAWQPWLADVVDRWSASPDRREHPFWCVHDTAAILRTWAELLTPERVTVLTVPPADAPRELLWRRFAGVVGVPAGVADTSLAGHNASLGLAEIEMWRRVNAGIGELPSWFYMRRLKEPLSRALPGARPAAGRLALPAERLPWARQEAQALIEGIRRAGHPVVGSLDELCPQPPAGVPMRPEDVRPDEVLDAALSAVHALLRQEFRLTVGERTGPAAAAPSGVVRRIAQRLAASGPLRRTVRRLGSRYRTAHRLRVLAWRVLADDRGGSD